MDKKLAFCEPKVFTQLYSLNLCVYPKDVFHGLLYLALTFSSTPGKEGKRQICVNELVNHLSASSLKRKTLGKG